MRDLRIEGSSRAIGGTVNINQRNFTVSEVRNMFVPIMPEHITTLRIV